jgi:histidine ammonia-lyase
MSVVLKGTGLTLDQVVRVARGREKVSLAEEARNEMRRSREVIQAAIDSNEPVYGINTGFGKLKDHRIQGSELEQLQYNLLRSHAAGVGEPAPIEVVRAMGLLRAESLAVGVSGVREEVVDALLALLNGGVHPIVPEQGSVGASGDLAPLAHYALVLIGEGEAEVDGHRLGGREALAKKNLEPLVLGPKEGLGLINGTQLSTSILALALADTEELCTASVGAAAMTLEAAMGSGLPMSQRVESVRRHPGHAWVAAALRKLIRGSEIMAAHASCDRLQDPYSLRCIPQVMGAAIDGIRYARGVVLTELASATDNPLVFPDSEPDAAWRERVISAGNFHGQPVSLAADVACIALSAITSIAERRLDLLMDSSRSTLPPFLTEGAGLHSGMMLTQFTAAALTSENKTLAHPASVDTIPTSAAMEDHVSMAPWAARKFARSVTNTRRVVACEYLAAAQALDLRRPLTPGRGVVALHAEIRAMVAKLEEDRPLAPDIDLLTAWIAGGGPRRVLEKSLGSWHSLWSEDSHRESTGAPS